MPIYIQNTVYINYKCTCCLHKITNVPVFLYGLDLMILMRENPFPGPLEGVGPESQDFFVP
jgi:hypothetical protein